jgi:hypothetical protein
MFSRAAIALSSLRTTSFLPSINTSARSPGLVGSLRPWRTMVATMASGEAVAGKKVGTHNGSFHCDEALGCFMMRLTSKFSDAEIVRSRDPKVGVRVRVCVCVCESV